MKRKEKVTIYDISKKLNISAATVSRALNNNQKISEKTRTLVLKTARDMNYKQNKLAKALKSGKSNIVGIIVPYIDRNFFASVIRGIEEILTEEGYQVMICQSLEDFDNEVEKMNALIDSQVDCIFWSISKSTQSLQHVKKAMNNNVPIIFFDRKIDVVGTSSIVIDDYAGAYTATEHLINQGCKRIAHIAGDLNLEIYKNRFQGYKQALEDNNIQFDEDYVIYTSSDIEAGVNAAKKLFSKDIFPDGVFAAGDFTALGVLKELKERKIKVPEEVKIVGFSNEPFTQHIEIPISSVDQNPLEMGKTAAEVFLEKSMARSTRKVDQRVVLSPELIIRKSSELN